MWRHDDRLVSSGKKTISTVAGLYYSLSFLLFLLLLLCFFLVFFLQISTFRFVYAIISLAHKRWCKTAGSENIVNIISKDQNSNATCFQPGFIFNKSSKMFHCQWLPKWFIYCSVGICTDMPPTHRWKQALLPVFTGKATYKSLERYQ